MHSAAASIVDGILGVTVSTVAVGCHGPAESKVLQDLATATGGKYYQVNSPNALPKIFQREARRVAQPLVHENAAGFVPVIRASDEITSGIGNPLPPITGFVRTTVKRNPLVEVAIISPEPSDVSNATILATWMYGLGRAVAYRRNWPGGRSAQPFVDPVMMPVTSPRWATMVMARTGTR